MTIQEIICHLYSRRLPESGDQEVEGLIGGSLEEEGVGSGHYRQVIAGQGGTERGVSLRVAGYCNGGES